MDWARLSPGGDCDFPDDLLVLPLEYPAMEVVALHYAAGGGLLDAHNACSFSS